MTTKPKRFFLILGDVLFLYVALYLTLRIRYGARFEDSVWDQHLLPFTIVYFIWITIFYTLGLYSLTRAGDYKTFFRALTVNAAVAIGFFYLVPYFAIAPKTNLFLNLGIFSLLFAVWRFIYGRAIRSIGATTKLALVGIDKTSLELARKVLEHPELGYKLIAVFNLDGKSTPKWVNNLGIIIGKDLTRLKKLTGEGKVDLVVVSKNTYSKIFGELYRLIPTGIGFYNLSSFWEDLNRSIPIYEADEVWFLENLRGVKKQVYELIKRVLDILFSIVFGFFAFLLFPFIALGIKLTDNGPVFYRQKRIGKDGVIFEMVKFRTMIPNAEKNGAQWASKNDSRITRFGRFLRLTRLDEIPQLINIFKGEMSFVGPRPERPEFVKKLKQKIPHYGFRHLIRPGLTGWAQINYPYGSSEEDARKKLRYDLYYLKHRSLLLDAEIALKTTVVVLSRSGR